MTRDEFRRKYRFPEAIDGRFEWRFFPLRTSRPRHYRYIRFYPYLREFRSGVVRSGDTFMALTDPMASLIAGKIDDDLAITEMIRSFLPHHILAGCVAATITGDRTDA